MGPITSDGVALLLKKLEERAQIVGRFAACFTDYRKGQPDRTPRLDLENSCANTLRFGVFGAHNLRRRVHIFRLG